MPRLSKIMQIGLILPLRSPVDEVLYKINRTVWALISASQINQIRRQSSILMGNFAEGETVQK